MKGVIVVHGTSQDITSKTETTVMIAKEARAAGHFVVEIGGPGSAERSIKRGEKRNPRLAEFSSIYEIEIPLDYGWDVLAGSVVGAGIDDIVEDIKAAVSDMLEKGVTAIDLVGFSRGAVALTLALERVEQEIGSNIRLPIPIGVCLLDPVPGSYPVPKNVTIPSFVDRFMLFTSKHEGRPWFKDLCISVSPGVEFTGDIWMGRHGDIGGSAGTDISVLVRDDVAKFLGLPACRLTPEKRMELTFNIIDDPSPYTKSGILQVLNRRAIGWPEHVHDANAFELPSAKAGEEIAIAPFLETPDKEDLPRNLCVIIPSRPAKNTNLKVVYPPARVVKGSNLMAKKVWHYGLKYGKLGKFGKFGKFGMIGANFLGNLKKKK